MATIFDTASGNLAQSGQVAGTIAGGGVPAQSMNSYINPYQSQVVGDTLARLQDQFQIRLGGIGDVAQTSGAYGGSRHGLVESKAFDDYLRNVGEVSGALNHQGFTTAMGAGFQDVNQRLAASGQLAALGGTGYNIGRTIQQDQLQHGNQQQQLAQALIDLVGGDFNAYVNSPMTSTAQASSIAQGSPLAGNMTQTTKPGLFDYLGLGLQTIGGMGRGGK